MAVTPYPSGQDRLENPALRASHDGLHWQAVPGVPDPLVQPPTDLNGHHADPDLVYHQGEIFLVYMTTGRTGTTFSVITCKDPCNWTPPRVIYHGSFGVSPAVVVDGTRWILWYVAKNAEPGRGVAPYGLLRREGPSLYELGEAKSCHIVIANHSIWHLDVINTDSGYEALISAYPDGADPSRSRLFHARSADGFVFTPTSSHPLLSPPLTGWDSRVVYRTTFLRNQEGRYRIWYSAASWGMRWGIGYVEGSLDNLTSPAQAAQVPPVSFMTRIRENLIGFAKYMLIKYLPSREIDRLQRFKRALVRGSGTA
jgi:hypothetical protein